MKHNGNFSNNSDDFYEQQLMSLMHNYKMKQKYYEKMLIQFKQSRSFFNPHLQRENVHNNFVHNLYTQPLFDDVYDSDINPHSYNAHARNPNLRTIFQPNLGGKHFNYFNKR